MTTINKGLVNNDPTALGIMPHWNIPQEVIDLILKMEGFSMNYVKDAAERYFQRIKLGIENRPGVASSDLADPQFYREGVQQSLTVLPTHPSVWTLGPIIEKCIIADKLEAWLRANSSISTK